MGNSLEIRPRVPSDETISDGNFKPVATKKKWRKPPAELVRFVRALAVDDARRDHDAALATTRRPRADGPDFNVNDRRIGRP